MAITGVQLIYRLKDLVRLLIDYRDNGGTPPDTFNLYWSSTEGGSYTLFAEDIINKPSDIPSIRGKIQYEFVPSTIDTPDWDNDQKNYIKLAPVTGGVVGSQEGPMEIPTRKEMIEHSEKSIMYGFNTSEQKFLPISVDEDGKIITA